MITNKEFKIVMDRFYEWWESGGCDADGEDAFWYGYELCMELNGLKQYVKDEENDES